MSDRLGYANLILVSGLAVFLTGCKQSESSVSHYTKANSLNAEKSFGPALVEARYAIRIDPGNSDYHYLAGEIEESLGDLKSAFSEYAQAAQPDLNNVKAQLKVEEILFSTNQFESALSRLNSTLATQPDNVDALALRALVEDRMGDSKNARSDAMSALSKDEGNVKATVVLTAQAIKNKTPSDAMTYVTTALKKHPSDVTLMQLEAGLFQVQGKNSDATEIYKRLIEIDPTSSNFRGALASLSIASSDLDAAEKVLNEGIKLAPNNMVMRAQLITFLNRYRSTQVGQARLRAWIEATPEKTLFDIALANELVIQKQPEQAISVLKTAIERVPTGPERAAAQLTEARILLTDHQVSEAVTVISSIIKDQPDNLDALKLGAVAMLQMSQYPKAKDYLLDLMARNPSDYSAYLLLSEAYSGMGQAQNSLQALARAVSLRPNDLSLAERLSNDQGALDLDAAKATLQDFIARNPNMAEARIALIRLAIRYRDWKFAENQITLGAGNETTKTLLASAKGELSEAQGAFGAATDFYKQAIQSYGGSAIDLQAATAYARNAIASNRAGEAIAFLISLQQHLGGDPNIKVETVLATLYRATNQLDAAQRISQEMINQGANQADGYIQSAQTMIQNGQLPAALDQIKAGIAAGAPKEPLLLTRAAIEERSDQIENAIATYDEILTINPASIVAANNFASLVTATTSYSAQQIKRAKEVTEGFMRFDDPEIIDTAAWVDYRIQDYAKAKELLERAHAGISKNPQLKFHYGAVLIATGNPKGGIDVLKSIQNAKFLGESEARTMLQNAEKAQLVQ